MTAPTEGADHVAVKVKRRKDGEAGRVHYLRRLQVRILGPNGAPMIDERGDPVTSVTMEHARADDTSVPMRERVLAHLAQAGEIGSTPREIATDIGVDHGTGGYKKVLNGLKSEGLIRTEGRTNATRYFLTED